MAFHPFFINPYSRRLMEQNFGMVISPDDLLTIIAVPQINRSYYRPWRNFQPSGRDMGSMIKTEKGSFQVNLDVQHFAPEEISVKTVDGYLIVDAKHEERADEHGFITRSFRRRYLIPAGVDENGVTSKLSSDGVLVINAFIKTEPNAENERVIPVFSTGPVKQIAENGRGVF